MSVSNTQFGSVALLVGSPRSGTTWLAKIIDSHPGVLYRHEPDSINVQPGIPFVPEADTVAQYLPACRGYLELIANERASKSAGSQPMFNKLYRSPLTERARTLMVYALKAGERLPGAQGAASRLQIPDMIDDDHRGKTLLLIKSVSSLCRSYMFSLAEPQMKFLHIVRHPCAYVSSTLRGKNLGLLSDDAYVETLAGMSAAEGYGFTLASLRDMSREEQLAVRWLLQNEKVMQEMQQSDNYKQVIYEDLCERPQAMTEEIFEFLGLDMNAQSEAFIEHSSKAEEEQVRYFELKRDSSSAASRWKKELSEQQIAAIREVVADSVVGGLYFAT